MADFEKHIASHDEVVHDKDLVGEKDVREAMHFNELSPEELMHEKKLRRKIDSIIMPMVVLVYLMNFIDRNNYPAAKLSGVSVSKRLDLDREAKQM